MGEISYITIIIGIIVIFLLFIAFVGQAARTWTMESLRTQKKFAFEENNNGKEV